jgi:hypothetical protein
MFPEKIQFDGKNCRTPKINEALLLILSIDEGSGAEEKRDKLKNMGLSLQVEKSYIFSHLFQSDLAKFITILKSVRQK